MEKRSFIFRCWYYFRNGWGLYFAFLFAAINTLTVTYYLAIEKIPQLQFLFPSFTHYVTIIAVIGVPILITIGYIHWKRSGAYRTEIEVNFESNPFQSRILVNSEINLKLNLKILELIIKISKSEKISEDEIANLEEFLVELTQYLKTRQQSRSGKKDLNFFRKVENFN